MNICSSLRKGVTGYIPDLSISNQKLGDNSVSTTKLQDASVTNNKIDTVSFLKITGKPADLASYGITNAYTKTEADARFASSSFGLGGTKVSAQTDISDTDYILSGFYLTPSYPITSIPTGWTYPGRYHVITSGNDSGYVVQMIFPADYPGIVATRTRSGTWSAWKQMATTNSPVFSGLLTCNDTIMSTDGTVKTVLSYGDKGVIGTLSNHGIDFITNNTSRMLLTDNGLIGVGKVPTCALDVYGVIGAYNQVNITGAYPWLSMKPNAWDSASYIQSGVDYIGGGAGDFTTFLNPAGKGYSFAIGGVSKTRIDSNGSISSYNPTFTGGSVTIKGLSIGALDTCYLPFVDSAGTRHGYIGKGDTTSSLYLVSDNGAVSIMPKVGSGVGIGLIAGVVPQATLHSTGTTILGISTSATAPEEVCIQNNAMLPIISIDNTKLVFKVRGSDGVVRIGTINLV